MSTDAATHRLAVRDLDPDDVAALKAAAAAAGQSSNAYLRELLRARVEHDRAVLQTPPTEPTPALTGLRRSRAALRIRCWEGAPCTTSCTEPMTETPSRTCS
ncbi:FitA-like ribbon-helix-helix domain-containing protein [Bounagaea algeriensis]